MGPPAFGQCRQLRTQRDQTGRGGSCTSPPAAYLRRSACTPSQSQQQDRSSQRVRRPLFCCRTGACAIEPRLDSSTVNPDRTPTVTRQPTAVSRQVPTGPTDPDSNINRKPDSEDVYVLSSPVKPVRREPDSPTARQPDSPAHNPDSPTAPPTSPTALPTIPTAPPTIWTRDSGQQAVSMHPCS